MYNIYTSYNGIVSYVEKDVGQPVYSEEELKGLNKKIKKLKRMS